MMVSAFSLHFKKLKKKKPKNKQNWFGGNKLLKSANWFSTVVALLPMTELQWHLTLRRTGRHWTAVRFRFYRLCLSPYFRSTFPPLQAEVPRAHELSGVCKLRSLDLLCTTWFSQEKWSLDGMHRAPPSAQSGHFRFSSGEWQAVAQMYFTVVKMHICLESCFLLKKKKPHCVRFHCFEST